MAADEGLRKLAAILAADVAGYSRLMADDDRATVRALTEYREIFASHIDSHQGRVVDTAGDSVLATFDSVVEAVEAAVEIQHALGLRNQALPDHRAMHFRIGVNLGDIIQRADGTLYGDGVNVAARLEGLAAPGGIMISESAHLQVADRLGTALEFAGAHDVKNIAKPVKAYRVAGEGAPTGTPPSQKTRRPALIAALAAVLATLVGLGVWSLVPRVETPTMVTADGTPTHDPLLAMPTGPLVAVLPFENRSDDPAQEYFSDGLTEDIITALSRFTGIRVAAPASTFKYKNADAPADAAPNIAPDIDQVQTDLDADFVLQGNVRRDTESLRITATLIDARTRETIWSETYDRDLGAVSIFAIQDEVTSGIVGKIADNYGIIAQYAFQRSVAKQSPTLTGYECVLKSAQFDRILTTQLHEKVRTCLEETVAREPDYADAWAALADNHNSTVGLGFTPRQGENPLHLAAEAANRALALDSDHQGALQGLAWAHFFQGNHDKVSTLAERAIAANPNAAGVYDLGTLIAYAGEWERGLAFLTKGMELNPDHAPWHHIVFGWDHYRKGEYSLAIAAGERIELMEHHYLPTLFAVANVGLGNMDRAREHLADALELHPNFAEDAHGTMKFWFPTGDLADTLLRDLVKAGLDIPELRELTN